ncbi:MAG: DUF2271 domain-containing protein [Novosphingobium sp.]|jgi:hypothetical protein|nr:DUF2271 domain-containing protein [Novosphingobium sp.]
MQLSQRIVLTGAALGTAGGLAAPATAQTVDVTVTIPRLTVAEYHRPYVAIWLEPAAGAPRTLAVWYDFDMKNNEGKKWLRDVRQWWRAAGRSLALPADGVSGATRAPGPQTVSFTAGRGPLGAVAPGRYTLVVEAAREVGGRELIRVPFTWPARPGQTFRAAGSTELGAVSITFRR